MKSFSFSFFVILLMPDIAAVAFLFSYSIKFVTVPVQLA